MRVDITGSLAVTLSLVGADTSSARLDTLEKQMSDLKTVADEIKEDEVELAAQETVDAKTIADGQAAIVKLEAAGTDPDTLASLKASHALLASLVRPTSPPAGTPDGAATTDAATTATAGAATS